MDEELNFVDCIKAENLSGDEDAEENSGCVDSNLEEYLPAPVSEVTDNLEDPVSVEAATVVPVKKKTFRKIRKKARKNLFKRPKKRGAHLKRIVSLLTPDTILNEETSNSLGLEGLFADHNDEIAQHSLGLAVKEEPASDDYPVMEQSVTDNSSIRVQKLTFQREFNRHGKRLFTPSETNPVIGKTVRIPFATFQMMKPGIKRIIHTSRPQQNAISQQPDIDHSYFMEETTEASESQEESILPDIQENIPVAAYTTISRSNAASQNKTKPGNIAMASTVLKPEIVPRFAVINQPGNPSQLSLVAVPLNKAGQQARHTNISNVSSTANLGNVSLVPLVGQPGNIPLGSLVVQPGNVPTAPQSTSSGSVPITSHIPKACGPLYNGILPPFTSLAESKEKVESATEKLLKIVGNKLLTFVPTPWITLLRPNGIALCLLNQADIVTIRRSLFVESTGKVTVGVHGKELPSENTFWKNVNVIELHADNIDEFTTNVIRQFKLLRGMEVCRAVEEFQPFWKNIENCEIDQNRFHEFRFTKCCRSHKCLLLVPNLKIKRCGECTRVWKMLSRRSANDSKKPETLSLHKPFKYLTSPEKRERFDRAVRNVKNLKMANKRLTDKLNMLLQLPENKKHANAEPDEDYADEEFPEECEMPDSPDTAS